MTETHDTKCHDASRFSLKSLLIFVFVICLVVGWWADRARLQRELHRCTEAARYGKLRLFEHLLRSEAVGKAVDEFPEVQRFAHDTFDETHVPLLWEMATEDCSGKVCIGYYFQTAELEEQHTGFYVLTVEGRIALIHSPGENFQLPDVPEWIENAMNGSGEDPFVIFGVRDPSAPNMLLNRWLGSNPPDPDYSALHPETVLALEKDAASIIDLHSVPLSNDLRLHVGNLRRVQWLRLSAGVMAADLRWLGQMRQLRGLSLSNADLRNADFQHLRNADSLQYLTVARTQMSPEDFSTLPRLDKLETLWLAGHQVTDAYLEHLAEIRLPSLLSLGLYDTTITDDGMKRLCEVYDLEYLDFFCSQRVTGESVPSIARMQNLGNLGVGMSGIAPQARRTAAVDQLIRLLPKCSVDYYD